jgi:hypothetical protein
VGDGTLDATLEAEAAKPKFLAAHRQIVEALGGTKRAGLPPSLLGT